MHSLYQRCHATSQVDNERDRAPQQNSSSEEGGVGRRDDFGVFRTHVDVEPAAQPLQPDPLGRAAAAVGGGGREVAEERDALRLAALCRAPCGGGG